MLPAAAAAIPTAADPSATMPWLSASSRTAAWMAGSSASVIRTPYRLRISGVTVSGATLPARPSAMVEPTSTATMRPARMAADTAREARASTPTTMARAGAPSAVPAASPPPPTGTTMRNGPSTWSATSPDHGGLSGDDVRVGVGGDEGGAGLLPPGSAQPPPPPRSCPRRAADRCRSDATPRPWRSRRSPGRPPWRERSAASRRTRCRGRGSRPRPSPPGVRRPPTRRRRPVLRGP